MACCLYFSQGLRTWLALLPIFAVFARLSSGHGALFFPITFIFLSTLFLLTFPRRKPIMPANSLQKEEAPSPQNNLDQTPQENVIISRSNYSCHDSTEAVRSDQDRVGKTKGEELLMGPQDLYSESESMDQCSSTSSEDHSSDIEWPYNVRHRVECSDGSISDEESLIEIAIPSGHFVSPDKDPRWNVDFCDQESVFDRDFWSEIYEMNEEDNLIEIDINMGSIKCSSF